MPEKTEFQMFRTMYGYCETQGCHSKASFYLGRPDCNPGNHRTICEKCAHELVQNIIAEYAPGLVEKAPNEEQTVSSISVKEGAISSASIDSTEITSEPVDPDEIILDELDVPALKSICKDLGLTGYSKKTREELILMIEAEAAEEE